jgi:hypothetical protein
LARKKGFLKLTWPTKEQPMYPKQSPVRLIYYCAVLCCILFPVLASAQEMLADENVAVPLDGGLSLLVIAGAGYGAKKIEKARSRKIAA